MPPIDSSYCRLSYLIAYNATVIAADCADCAWRTRPASAASEFAVARGHDRMDEMTCEAFTRQHRFPKAGISRLAVASASTSRAAPSRGNFGRSRRSRHNHPSLRCRILPRARHPGPWRTVSVLCFTRRAGPSPCDRRLADRFIEQSSKFLKRSTRRPSIRASGSPR